MTTRNTKEVALIQIRSGNQAEMPKALHQSEFGLAKDTNKLFIGNSENSKLNNRTVFPYKNLEILTEFSDLKDYFKYTYENNITNVGTSTERLNFREALPIIVSCTKAAPTISANGSMTLNDSTVTFTAGQTMNQIINTINAVSATSGAYATVLQSINTNVITIVSVKNALTVTGDTSILSDIGFPSQIDQSNILPKRNLSEKLDDTLHITDFGIKGDGVTNYSSEIERALIGIYKRNTDKQFFRSVLFPAGTYVYSTTGTDELDPFPLISNEYISGEGIDRTVITADYLNDLVLLIGLDGNLNRSNSSNYGVGAVPENIYIEDITFDCSCLTLGVLNGIKNITFNRVKFKGESGTTLIRILGTSTHNAQNILFNECIFEHGACGIEITEFAKNITIQNSKFDTLTNNAIVIGNNSVNPVSAINLSNNVFTNCATTGDGVNPNTYVIKVLNNAKYVSIHQSQFDQAVVERTGSILPYADLGTGARKNYCDTLDPNTDAKKVLMFNFTQPEWKYLDKLVDSNGNVVIGVNVASTDITSTNGMLFTTSNSYLKMSSTGTGNVILATDNNADIIIGDGTSTGDVGGNIIFRKNVEMGGGGEISPGDKDFTIKLQNNHIVKIDDTESQTDYKSLIGNTPNAIPNVDYVKSLVYGAAASSIIKHIKYTDLVNLVDGALPIITFDPTTYSDNVHIKGISINVRNPFYEAYDNLASAVTYTTNYVYYKGDLVTDGSNYGVVINKHTATSGSIINDNVVLLTLTAGLTDISYVDIVGNLNSSSYSLTEQYNSGYVDAPVFKPVVNIRRNNTFGNDGNVRLTSTLQVDPGYKKFIRYSDRVYKYKNNTSSAITLTPSMLHESTVTRFYDEGNNYTFDMDSNLLDLNTNLPTNLYSINWSGYTLKMVFFDANKTLMPIISDIKQLNPAGDMVVKIDYYMGAV